MRFASKTVVALFAVGTLACFSQAPAFAGCQVISATHSADTPQEARIESQQLAVQSAIDLKHEKHWKSYSMTARKVTPDPFWKMVRPVVPSDIIIKPDLVTAKTHTTCWPGVVVPYVCTSGSKVCGN